MYRQNIKTVAIGTVFGTIVLTVWGMGFWGVLYEPVGVFNSATIDSEIVQVLDQSDIQTGTYFYPWPRNTAETQQTWLSRHTSGPFFKLSFVREGVNPQSPMKLVRGTAHNATIALLSACLLLLASYENSTFRQRFLLILIAGTMGTWMTWGGDVIWFHMPIDYAIGSALYEVGCWLLLGALMAWCFRSKGAAAGG